MSLLFYNIFLVLFRAGVRVASLFDSKAKKWVRGRKNIFENLSAAIGKNEQIIWIHCASLGEFEQGRPLIERLKAQNLPHKILLTFFSPSGYEVQKDYKGADWVFYLPPDGPGNARLFLEIVRPRLAIFVKYEFWYYYLKKIKYREIPLILVSALFRRDMSFFKWYGGLQRKMLGRFDHLFVQNQASKNLMDEIGLAEITSISGDTRFDRVIEIASRLEPIPAINRFTGGSKVIVAGSTWPEDEGIIQNSLASVVSDSLKLIIAPHEISNSHLGQIKKLFPGSILYSALAATNGQNEKPQQPGANVLIVDNYGMLSRLYHYADIAFVGGAFRKMGVHNVIEAAVYGKPVIFGPFYKKYTEAVELVKEKGAIPVSNAQELESTVLALLKDQEQYSLHCRRSHEYVWNNKGASDRIIQFIQEKRLLTS